MQFAGSRPWRGMEAAGDSRWPGRMEAAAPWLLSVAALAVRLFRLGQDPFWFDEAYTALNVGQPIERIFELVSEEAGAPLYYLLMHPWAAWVGDGEFALRLTSAVLGALAVPLLYVVGASMFSRRAGLIAAALAVVSPLHLHYSQEFRMYPLVALVAIGVLYGLHRLLVAPTLGKGLLVGVLLLGGIYLHYYFLFLLPLSGFALLAADRRSALYAMALSLGVVIAGFAPWLPIFLDQLRMPSAEWTRQLWESRSILFAVPWSLECFGPTAEFPPYVPFKFFSFPGSRMLSGGIALGILAMGIGSSLRRWPGAPARAGVLTIAALLIPLLGALGVSLIRGPVYVVARHDLISWGPYCLLAGVALAGLRRRAAIGSVVIWALVAGLTLKSYWSTTRTEAGTQIAAQILDRAAPQDIVIFAAGARTTTEYHLREARSRFRLLSYPMSNDAHLGWIDLRVFSDHGYALQEAIRLSARLREWRPAPQAIWVANPRHAQPLIERLAAHGYRESPDRSTDLLLSLQRPSANP